MEPGLGTGISTGAMTGIIAAGVAAAGVLAAVAGVIITTARRRRQASPEQDISLTAIQLVVGTPAPKESKGSSVPSGGSGPAGGKGSGDGGGGIPKAMLTPRLSDKLSSHGSGPFEDLFSWEIPPDSLSIVLRPSGEEWLLGKGAFGRWDIHTFKKGNPLLRLPSILMTKDFLLPVPYGQGHLCWIFHQSC